MFKVEFHSKIKVFDVLLLSFRCFYLECFFYYIFMLNYSHLFVFNLVFTRFLQYLFYIFLLSGCVLTFCVNKVLYFHLLLPVCFSCGSQHCLISLL